jgi:hypothetical protein
MRIFPLISLLRRQLPLERSETPKRGEGKPTNMDQPNPAEKWHAARDEVRKENLPLISLLRRQLPPRGSLQTWTNRIQQKSGAQRRMR